MSECLTIGPAMSWVLLVLVHQEADLLKGEERDPDGEHDVGDLEALLAEPVEAFEQELEVLVVADEQEVAGDAKSGQRSTGGRARGSTHGAPQQVVRADREDQDSQIAGAPVAVEEERRRDEQRPARPRAARRHHGVQRQEHQEKEEKPLRRENHGGRLS
jgi:hypothetical protein